MPPVRAVSTIEIAGFAPGTTSTVTDPAFVCTPLAAYARIANVRLGPVGTLIVSTATPTSVAGVPAASTRTKRAAAAPLVRPGSRHVAKATRDASATGTALHRARDMGVPRGRVRLAAPASSAPINRSPRVLIVIQRTAVPVECDIIVLQ